MEIQNSNQTVLESIAMDNAQYMAENIFNANQTIDEAVEMYIEGMMEDSFDDDQFDAPYDPNQVRPILREALVAHIAGSATNLHNYASAHPEAYIRDYDDENEIGEEVVVRVIQFEGDEYHVVFGDAEDLFHNKSAVA